MRARSNARRSVCTARAVASSSASADSSRLRRVRCNQVQAQMQRPPSGGLRVSTIAAPAFNTDRVGHALEVAASPFVDQLAARDRATAFAVAAALGGMGADARVLGRAGTVG